MVLRVGLEPTTNSLKGYCSNQLSYRSNGGCMSDTISIPLLCWYFTDLSGA